MSKTRNEKKPMGMDKTIKCISIEFETIPPQKGKTEAQKPKVELNLLQEGDEYITIKAENTKGNER